VKIANYEIQPILLHIPDEEVYNVRHNEMLQRLNDIGIHDTYSVKGIQIWKFMMLLILIGISFVTYWLLMHIFRFIFKYLEMFIFIKDQT
jgi:hypothetical protein